MAPRQLCHGLWHKALGGWPGLGEGTHVVQVAPRPAPLVRELRSQVGREPVDHPAAPPGLLLPVQDVPADRPVQPQQLTVSRPHLRGTDPGLELLEQLGVAGRLRQQPAHTHRDGSRRTAVSRPVTAAAQGARPPARPGCPTPAGN